MFTGTLLTKQKPAATKLVQRKNMLLAWEQGTGKTIIALAASEHLLGTNQVKSILILAQPGNAWQWGDRINEFTTSKFILVSAKDKRSREYETDPGTPYYIVPWSLFIRDYETILGRSWDVIIADEAQILKNNTNKTPRALKKLSNKIKPDYRWALTGTAISNKLEELYSILYWVDRSLLPPWPIFEERHIIRNDFGGIQGYKDLLRLNEYLTKTKLDRRTHADFAGEMPKLVSQIHKVEQSKEYKKAETTLLGLLDDMVTDLHFDEEGNPSIKESPQVRSAFHTVRQELYSAAKHKYIRGLVEGILAENERNRIVIFSHYKSPLYQLRDDYWSQAPMFTGDQSTDEKHRAIKSFEKSERVLLASNAGRAGLDLPFANYVINIDVPFSHEVLDQRIKRVTRLSSDFATCVVIYLLMEDSIEEFYLNVVLQKGRLAKAVKEGGEDEVIVREQSLRAFIKDKKDGR